jgi:hypothetical protein
MVMPFIMKILGIKGPSSKMKDLYKLAINRQ